MTKKYNPEIDIWKFVFSIIVFLFHSYKLDFTVGTPLFGKGYLAVEFFYLVSGYFMAASIKKLEGKAALPGKPETLGTETVKFIGHKISRLYLPYINAFIIAFLVKQYTLHSGIRRIIKDLAVSFNEILMLQMSATTGGRLYNGPAWYISAMVIAMFVLYPVVRRHRNMFSRVMAPVIAVLCLSYLCQNYSCINLADSWTGFAYAGLIRAFADISLGTTVFAVCEYLGERNISLTPAGKAALWLVKAASVAAILLIMQYGGGFKNGSLDILVILLFCLFLTIVMSGLCRFERLHDFKFIRRLGDIGLALYLNQRCVINYINSLDGEWDYWGALLRFAFGTAVVMAVAIAAEKLETLLFSRLFGFVKRKIISPGSEQPVSVPQDDFSLSSTQQAGV